MTSRSHRTQILLDQEQHRTLTDLAHREGRSLSDIIREFVQVQLEQREQDHVLGRERQLAALDRIRAHRQAVAARLGAEGLPDPAEILDQLREERDAELTSAQHRR